MTFHSLRTNKSIACKDKYIKVKLRQEVHLLVEAYSSSRHLYQLVGDLLTMYQSERLDAAWTCNDKQPDVFLVVWTWAICAKRGRGRGGRYDSGGRVQTWLSKDCLMDLMGIWVKSFLTKTTVWSHRKEQNRFQSLDSNCLGSVCFGIAIRRKKVRNLSVDWSDVIWLMGRG